MHILLSPSHPNLAEHYRDEMEIFINSKQSWSSLGKLWYPKRQECYLEQIQTIPLLRSLPCPPTRLPSSVTVSMPLPLRMGLAAGSMEACRPEWMENLYSASVEKSKQSVVRHNRVETCSLVLLVFTSTVKALDSGTSLWYYSSVQNQQLKRHTTPKATIKKERCYNNTFNPQQKHNIKMMPWTDERLETKKEMSYLLSSSEACESRLQ